jgi:hypothetical protein
MQGLKVDQVDDVRRNTVFTVASMMGGTGVMKPEHAAVCVGQPVEGVTFSLTDNHPVYAATHSGANRTYGDFTFDGTTGDITSYKVGTASAANTGGAAGTAVTGDVSGSDLDATDDGILRDAYQAALGAYALNAADDSSAEANPIDGAFAAEYTTGPDHSIYAADSAAPGFDGLGT